MFEKIRYRLKKEACENYRQFSTNIIPNINNILGVRMPTLRKIASEIYFSNNWREYIQTVDVEFMEENLLKALIIGQINSSANTILQYVKDFIPRIDNWAVCDTFCITLKFTNKNKEQVWKFIQPYFKSQKEFELRFAFVMFLNYFVDEKYIDFIFNIFDEFVNDAYYARMAVAWALSICMINEPNKTFKYLKKSKLDNWTYNKAIQKCLESYRISKKQKLILKKMKK